MLQIRTDINQGSDEWYRLRLGKITGSCFSKLLGGNGAKEKYLYDRANEIVTGCRSDSDNFTNVHMRRGIDFESEAKSQYVMKTFSFVEEVGLMQLGDYVACSPDGLIDEDGLIEIKVPDSNNYFRQMLEISLKGNNAIPHEHYVQMQFYMYVCGREWCDYVLYNPQHVINNKELFIHRVEREEEIQTNIGNVLDECVIKIKKYVEQYYAII
jgi:hypothetical protein